MPGLRKLKLSDGTNAVLFRGNELTYTDSIRTVLGVGLPTAQEAALPVAKVGPIINSNLAARVVVETQDPSGKRFSYNLICSIANLANALGSGANGLIGKQIRGRTIVAARNPGKRIFVD